jgi:hypothetical protein
MNAIKPFASLTLAFLTFAFPVIPQERKTPSKEDNLYSMALFTSITEMDKSWDHMDDSDGKTVRTDYHNMTVEQDPTITKELPSQFGDYRLTYLDASNQIAKYQTVGKAFSILRIHPMQNDGARLEIQVSVYYFSYEKRRLAYALSDWSTVEFRFDCEKQKFLISSVKLGGI